MAMVATAANDPAAERGRQDSRRNKGSSPVVAPSKPRLLKVLGPGLITGAAGSEIYAVAREGIDTFVTGEAPHWAAVAAEELGINLLLGGHYATETFGVKALAAHLADRFNLTWEFIDSPTGL